MIIVLKGGPGSGFYGHKGRKGEVGGSLPKGVLASTSDLHFGEFEFYGYNYKDSVENFRNTYKDKFLFHTTSAKNLQSIQKTGLVSGKKSNYAGYVTPEVAYATTVDEALYFDDMRQANVGKDKGILLRVKFSDVNPVPYKWHPNEVRGSEASPDKIEIWTSDRWIPINSYEDSIVLKGGPGSGFYGHKGRPGLVGGSTALGVMPKAINGLNIPNAAYADSDMLYSFEQVELFNKLVTHSFGDGIVPRQTLENKIYGSYVISPNGEILQGKNLTESHTEIFAYLALSKPYDFIDEDMRLRATNILFTARDEDEDIELQFLKAGYIDVRSITGSSYAIKFAGEINTNSVKRVLKLIDTGKIPSNYGGTFSLYSIDKHSRAVHIPAAELDSIVGFRTTEAGSVYELEPILKELKFKGGPGSGFYGHKGRPGLEGGSTARGVLSSQNSEWRRLNIPDKGKYFEKVSKIIADPREDADYDLGGWSSYMVTPDGEVYWCPSGHNKAAKEIIENNTLTSEEDISRKKYRVDLANIEAYSNDNYLIHNFGFTRVMISKNELTLQTHILDKSTLRFLQGLYDKDKMELRNKIVWVGALDIESGLPPKSYANVNVSREEFLDAKYIVQDPDDKPEYKNHAYLLKESILKGGIGSGFYDHKGRKGLVGGSVARGVLLSGNTDNYSGLQAVLNSDKFPEKMKTNLKIMYDRFDANYIPDNSVVLTKIAPNIPKSSVRSDGGFGACGKVSLDAIAEDPSLKLYYGITYDKYDISKYEEFDPALYWGGIRAGTPHIWNVDTQGRVVDHAFGSRNASGNIYVGAELNPRDFNYDDAKVLNHLYDTMNKDTSTTEVMNKLYAEWSKLPRDKSQMNLKELKFKGGQGSGFHGHKGRKGEVGGSIARVVLSSQVNNILQKFESNPGFIKNPVYTGVLDSEHEVVVHTTRRENTKSILDNGLIVGHPTGKSSVGTVRDPDHNWFWTQPDMSNSMMNWNSTKEDVIIAVVPSADIIRIPESRAAAYRSSILPTQIYGIIHNGTKLKELIYKGGVGSGFHGHKGRKGLIGGSVARGVLSSSNKYSDKLIIPTSEQSRMDDSYFGIKEIRVTDCARGSGSFFITDNGTVLELVAGDHASATAAIARANGMDYGDGDNEITPRRLVTEYGFIRLNMTPHGANFEVAKLDNSILRKLQKLVDDGEVDIASKFEVIMSNAETFEYVQAPIQDFLSAKYVVLQNANTGEYVLKETILKGGPGSGFYGHKGRKGLQGGSIARGVLASQISENLIRQANKTSRNTGAVGAKAIVPKYVESIAKPSDTILDFGAGKAAAHALRLQSAGLNVTPYEFGENSIPGLHNPNALKNKYSIVYASNVLNVQGSDEMLQDTLNQLTGALKNSGKLVVNLPGTPRYGAWTGLTDRQGADKLQSILMDRFEKVVRVGGTTSTPLFEASELKINKEMFIGRLR